MKLICTSFFQGFILILFFISISAFPISDKNAPTLLMQADLALLKGEFDTASKAYLKGLKKARPNEKAAVWDDLGYVFLQKGELPKAIEYLEKAKQAFPENYNIRFYLALAALLNDNIDSAADELANIEKNVHFDADWMPRTEESQLYTSYGNSLDRDDWESLHLEKGVLIRKTGHEQSLQRWILYPDAFDERNEGFLYFIQGVVQQKLGRPDKMQAWFQSAVQTGYDRQEIETQQQQPERQLSSLIKANVHHRLKNHQNNLLWEKIQASQSAVTKGDINEAIRSLEAALLIDESSYVANFTLALLYFTQAGKDNYIETKLQKAEIKCARAKWLCRLKTTEKEDTVKCLDLMANIYFRQGKLSHAETELNNILKLDQKNSSALYKLGGVYHLQKDFSKAESSWKNAIAIAENLGGRTAKPAIKALKNPVVYLSCLSLGSLYLEQKRFFKASIELELAVQLVPYDARPYLELARAYIGLENKEKAAAAVNKYLELEGPDPEKARRLLEKLK